MPAAEVPTIRSKKVCRVADLGRVGYAEALLLQQRLAAARKAGAIGDVLLLCEHPHVITLGRNGKMEHLYASEAVLHRMGVEFHHANRGGDITYHGPGQVIGYPILQLAEIRRDVVWYVRQLEEVMIAASAAYGIDGARIAGRTGVWVRGARADGESAGEEKIGAIGVHISRWVTSHGFAYNLATDLRYFDLILPCGISGGRVTSLDKLLGRTAPRMEFTTRLVAAFGEALGLSMAGATRTELEAMLMAAEGQPVHLAAG